MTDAALIAAQTDGALLVVRHSRTTKDQLQGAVDRLAGCNAHAGGVVFNMTPRKSGRGGYGYAPKPEEAKGKPAEESSKARAGPALSAADARVWSAQPKEVPRLVRRRRRPLGQGT